MWRLEVYCVYIKLFQHYKSYINWSQLPEAQQDTSVCCLVPPDLFLLLANQHVLNDFLYFQSFFQDTNGASSIFLNDVCVLECEPTLGKSELLLVHGFSVKGIAQSKETFLRTYFNP